MPVPVPPKPPASPRLFFVHGGGPVPGRAPGRVDAIDETTGLRETVIPPERIKGAHVRDLAVSPDGTKIVLGEFVPTAASSNPAQHLVLYELGSDTRRDLTPATSDVEDIDPVFAPDGRTVVFARLRFPIWGCGRCPLELRSVALDGSGERQLTTMPPFRGPLDGGPFYGDRQPSFSHDGRRIVFVRNSDQSGMYTMNADGSDLRLLFPDPQVCWHGADPAWSPDGHSIAFLRNGETGNVTNLFVMRADGTGLRQLTRTVRHNPPPDDARCGSVGTRESEHIQPAWSPDSSRIVFASNRDQLDNPDGPLMELFSLAPDGTGLRKLTTNPSPVDVATRWAHPSDSHPSYGPRP
jgi:Tol biopolymer transport system component